MGDGGKIQVKEFTGMWRLKPDADLEAFTNVLAPSGWPGPVETPLTTKELESPAIRELFMTVLPRRPMDAAEVAEAAVHLAFDKARSINGHTIVVDAGSLTRGYPPLLSPLTLARTR
jgi:hypothetical protein